jgi:two-component system NtrC family sensor kinase
MPRRLAQKLVLSLTIIVSIIAAISGLFNVKTEERQLVNAMILGADQLSKSIASATWHAMLANHREDAYQVMQTIALKQGIDRIRIFNRAGQVMYSTKQEEPHQIVDKRSEACVVCHSAGKPRVLVDASSRVRISHADGHRNLAMVTAIYNEPACSQAACHAHPAAIKVLGVLDLSLNLDSVDREVGALQFRVFLVTAIEILLIAVFIMLFTRRFLSNPISKLVDGTKAVSAMQLDTPIEISGSSEEIDELAHSFNAMQDRLRQALGELNQFTQNLESEVERRSEQLKAAHQKLVQSDRLASLGTLAASVAHEINNPLSGVLNLSMLMQRILKEDGIPPDRLPEFRKYLSQVEQETTRVGRIVSDLLSFSRRSKPQHSPADLNRLVRSTLSLVSHKLKLAEVEVRLDLADDLPTVSCDASQIRQVILNLLLNASEATQSKPQRRMVVRTRGAGETVEFIVEDNGEGIRPENIGKIFDPFFTTKSEGKGVGLGLAVSYGIVQAHNGDIEVHSQPGMGTTFTMTLPTGHDEPVSGHEHETALGNPGSR